AVNHFLHCTVSYCKFCSDFIHDNTPVVFNERINSFLVAIRGDSASSYTHAFLGIEHVSLLSMSAKGNDECKGERDMRMEQKKTMNYCGTGSMYDIGYVSCLLIWSILLSFYFFGEHVEEIVGLVHGNSLIFRNEDILLRRLK
ncbi:hypothetical protein L9F63_006881, partial [Diploptera punctata]